MLFRSLEEQAGRVQARQRHEDEQWLASPAPLRGPRPDLGSGLAEVEARRRAVEADAAQSARVFAGQVRAAVESLPGVPTLRSVLTSGYLFAYALPSGVGTLLEAPGEEGLRRVLPQRVRRSFLPPALHGPLDVLDRRFGPARFTANVDTMWNGAGNSGARDVGDRVMAGVDTVALVGVYSSGGLAVSVAGVGSAGYVVITTAWDHRPRGRTRPGRPSVLWPAVARQPGHGLRPPSGPPPGFTVGPRPAPPRGAGARPRPAFIGPVSAAAAPSAQRRPAPSGRVGAHR